MPLHLLTAHVGTSGLLLAAAAKKTTSSGSSIFLYLIVIMVGVYLLWLRPQKKRQQAAARAQREVSVGDEVLTAAGIYGRIVSLDDERAVVEIAPGTEIEVSRRALGTRVDPVVPEPDGADATEPTPFPTEVGDEVAGDEDEDGEAGGRAQGGTS